MFKIKILLSILVFPHFYLAHQLLRTKTEK